MTILTLRDLGMVGAATGALWTPSQITTALWLDAADSSTITTVSGAVSQWNDKSGNGRNVSQGTAANRPTYTSAGQNGRNTLTFDGSDDGLALAADLDIKTQHTILVAATNSTTITAATSAQTLLSGSGYIYPSTTTSELLLGAGARTGNLTSERLYSVSVAYASGGAQVYGYGKTNADVTGGFIIANSFTTTANTFIGRLNGASDFATAGSAGGYTTANTNYPSTIRGIGFRFADNSAFWNGSIYEVVILLVAATTTVTQQMEGYLAHKWGLTANLPSDHPYKTAPPLT